MPHSERVYYEHLRLGRGGATLAFARAEVDGVALVQVGASLCSPRDRYSRARGRAIAEGRQTGPWELRREMP